MPKVLIVDQFSGLTPYWLQKNSPLTFTKLEELARGTRAGDYLRTPRTVDVPEDYQPEMCETVFRETADGLAEFWKCKWDSSG